MLKYVEIPVGLPPMPGPPPPWQIWGPMSSPATYARAVDLIAQAFALLEPPPWEVFDRETDLARLVENVQDALAITSAGMLC